MAPPSVVVGGNFASKPPPGITQMMPGVPSSLPARKQAPGAQAASTPPAPALNVPVPMFGDPRQGAPGAAPVPPVRTDSSALLPHNAPDGDETLPRDELATNAQDSAEAGLPSQVAGSPRATSGAARVYDQDGDGKISRDEFAAYLQNMDEARLHSAVAGGSPPAETGSPLATGTAHKYDQDGDGKISRDEFAAYLQDVAEAGLPRESLHGAGVGLGETPTGSPRAGAGAAEVLPSGSEVENGLRSPPAGATPVRSPTLSIPVSAGGDITPAKSATDVAQERGQSLPQPQQAEEPEPASPPPVQTPEGPPSGLLRSPSGSYTGYEPHPLQRTLSIKTSVLHEVREVKEAPLKRTLSTELAEIAQKEDQAECLNALKVAAGAGNLGPLEAWVAKKGRGRGGGGTLDVPLDPEGNTALIVAATVGAANAVVLLLSKGASPHVVRACDGTPPLVGAAWMGHEACVAALLEAGADPNVARGLEGEGETALFAASGGGHHGIVRRLLEAGADVDAGKSCEDGCSPLYIAVQNGLTKVVRELLDAGAAPNLAPAKTGATPLFAACTNSHAELVSMLLQSGAEPDRARKGPAGGDTPLYAAVCKGAPLLVGMLLANGASADKAKTDGGATPLWRAASDGNAELCKLLLDAGHASVDKAREIDGSTPLFVASRHGHVECMAVLLAHGADALRWRAREDSDPGESALYVAALKGHARACEVLLDAGVPADHGMRCGRATPLMAACVGEPTPVPREPGAPLAVGAGPDVVELLVARGADPNWARPGDGATPLYLASYTGRSDVVRALVKVGATPDLARADNGATPLLAACELGHYDVAQALTEAGADPTLARRDTGYTPVAAAAVRMKFIKSHERIAKMFESMGHEIPNWVDSLDRVEAAMREAAAKVEAEMKSKGGRGQGAGVPGATKSEADKGGGDGEKKDEEQPAGKESPQAPPMQTPPMQTPPMQTPPASPLDVRQPLAPAPEPVVLMPMGDDAPLPGAAEAENLVGVPPPPLQDEEGTYPPPSSADPATSGLNDGSVLQSADMSEEEEEEEEEEGPSRLSAMV